MSVDSSAVLNIYPLPGGLQAGLARFAGYLALAGDGSGGVWRIGMDFPSFPQLFPGKNYWRLDQVEWSASATLANPYGGVEWWLSEIVSGASGGTSGFMGRQIYMSQFSDLLFVMSPQTGTGTLGPGGSRNDRWYLLDKDSPGYWVHSVFGPNTNGVTAYLYVIGFLASEKYIQLHGLF